MGDRGHLARLEGIEVACVQKYAGRRREVC